MRVFKVLGLLARGNAGQMCNFKKEQLCKPPGIHSALLQIGRGGVKMMVDGWNVQYVEKMHDYLVFFQENMNLW